MELIQGKLSTIKTEEIKFQITNIRDKPKSKDIDKLRIYNNTLYAYLLDNSIKVYNCNTFEEISDLKLPFNRGKNCCLKEHIGIEILENDIVIILADKKLYFYEIDLKANKLKFLLYLEEVYHFCYLQQKKEIVLLTENKLIGDYYGMAKSDLRGNIIFRNKQNKPQIYSQYKPPNEVSFLTGWNEMSSKNPIHFSQFDSFNNEKYIIDIFGYTDNWEHFAFYGPKYTEYTMIIYNSNNLEELYNKEYKEDLRNVKITDIYFKKSFDDLSIFYYDEKTNTVQFITDVSKITNPISKYLYEKPDNEKRVDNDEDEKIKAFYLKENMFGIFDYKDLFIVDLSSNGIIRKIQMKKKEDENVYIKSISYLNKNEKEHLYISIDYCYNNYNTKNLTDMYEFKHKIISGIII